MMRDWSGKHVLVIGAARQGLAATRYLVDRGARVTLNDRKPAGDLVELNQALGNRKVELVFGGHPLELLDGTDMLCISGGVPLSLDILTEADWREIPVTNDSQLFMSEVPCPVIGITGSAGKTTTTTLLGRMAQAAVERGLVSHPKAWVGGNIGTPLIDQLEQIRPEDLVILELSSFQLELMTIAPHLAAVLNITPNHLDRHGNMAAYTAVKQRILNYQKEGDVAILNHEDPGSFGLAGAVKGQLVTFGMNRSELPGTFLDGDSITLFDGKAARALFSRSLVELRGRHNLLNVIAAAAIAWSAGIPVEAMAAALMGFTGVPHRLEYIRTYHGARWYNDSKSTTPDSTIAAIRAFDEPLVLLLGGRDKHLPWEDLARLVKGRVKQVILFGEAAAKIAQVMAETPGAGKPVNLVSCVNLEEAVQAAASCAIDGDVVLLAPGGTSYDQFTDFEERGDRFKQWVNKLS
jgi:UDP-N-acetylmuramoylalanine--D-glutamate ligase